MLKKNSTGKLTATWKVLSIWAWRWGRWGLDSGGDRGADVMTAGTMAMMIQEWWSFLPLVQVPQEVAQGWCKEKDIPYFEVSAKNDINVVQAFEMLASRALSRVSGTLQGCPLGWAGSEAFRKVHGGHREGCGWDRSAHYLG